MQAPLLPPGISRVPIEQPRQQHQQHQLHRGMALQGSGQQHQQQLQVLHHQHPVTQRLLHTQHQQLQALRSQQFSQAQHHLHAWTPQHNKAQSHQLQQQQHQKPLGCDQDQNQEKQHQHKQVETPRVEHLTASNNVPAYAVSEHATQYPYLLPAESLPGAGTAPLTATASQPQQLLQITRSSNRWAPAGISVPPLPVQLQPRAPHQQEIPRECVSEQQPLLQQQHEQVQSIQPPVLPQQQLVSGGQSLSPPHVQEYDGHALRQRVQQGRSDSPYNAVTTTAAAIPLQQDPQLHVQHQVGPEIMVPDSSMQPVDKMQQQQPAPPVLNDEALQEKGQEDAAERATAATLSDCGEGRVLGVPESAKHQERNAAAGKAPQKTSARSGRAKVSQKASCFEILYQDALHRRTRHLRTELARSPTNRRTKGQTCTPQQWEQRWNLMIKRHQEKIFFNEALKRKLELSKREDEGRECTFKPVTWSLRKPLVQQKRRLLKLEALAEQQQVLKEALFVLQYEEKQMDEYIAMKLQEEVGSASAQEKTDEELKSVLDFYRDRKIEETNRHRSMKLDLLTQLTRLDQQYKRTAASGNLQDTEAAEAVGFDLSLSDKIREDIMEELDSVNSLRSGAKFRAIWEASVPVYNNSCTIEELQSDGPSTELAVGGGCTAAPSCPRAVAAAEHGRGGKARLALGRSRGACSDRYGMKTLYHRRNSSGSAAAAFSPRATAAASSLARNTFASSSPSCISKSRRGSFYRGGIAPEEQPLRMSQLAASQLVSPRLRTPYTYDNAPQSGGRAFAQQEYSWNQTPPVARQQREQQATQQLRQRTGSPLPQLQQEGCRNQQQATIPRNMEAAQEQRQGGIGQPPPYEVNDQTIRDSAQQTPPLTLNINFSSTVNSAGAMPGAGAAAGASDGHYPPAFAAGNCLPMVNASPERASTQQTGWQPPQRNGINKGPRAPEPFLTEPSQELGPSSHVPAAAAPAAHMYHSPPQQQQLGRRAQPRSPLTDKRNPLKPTQRSTTAQQQPARSPGEPAFYGEYQPKTSPPLYTAAPRASPQLPTDVHDHPVMHQLQHQQQGHALYPPNTSMHQQQQQHVQIQQQRIQRQELQQEHPPTQTQSVTPSQSAQCQRSAAAGGTWIGATQQTGSHIGAGGIYAQTYPYSSNSAILPSALTPTLQPLQGLPAHAGHLQQQSPSVAAAQPLTQQQRQRAGYQQQLENPLQHASQQQLTTSSQTHAGQRFQGVASTPTSQQQRPSYADASTLPAALRTNHHQVQPPPVTQPATVTSTQESSQPQAVTPAAAAASGAAAHPPLQPSPAAYAGGRASAPRAAERPAESWKSPFLGLQERAAAALQLQQQQFQRAFVLPAAAGAPAPPRASLVKGTSLVQMPPFPSNNTGLVDFAAAAKLCQRGNMLFAAR